MSAVAKNYAKLCIKGVQNFNEIPEKYKKEARGYITAQGYIINPDGTVEPAPVEEIETDAE